MATIRKIERQSGVVYKAIIKQRGVALKSKTFDRKTDAVAWAKRIEADQDAIEALGSRGAGLKFSELVNEYAAQWSGKCPRQLPRAAYWNDCFGHYKLIDINADMIRKELKAFESSQCLRGDGKGKTQRLKKTRSPATVNRLRAVLSAVFKYAMGEGIVTQNPVNKVPARKVSNQRTRYLKDFERESLLKACEVSEWRHLRLLVLMAMTSGMRKSELMWLRWSDMDFDRNLAFLADTKNGEARNCPIPEFVMVQLRPMRRIGNSLLFPSTTDSEKPFEFKKHWFKAMADAGIENFRWHDLRHTAASLLAMGGASLYEVGQVLGHRCAQTTMRYSHLSTEHKSRLVDKVMTAAIQPGRR